MLGRPKQVHFCTGVVGKMNRKIWWVTSTKYPLFLSTIFRSGNVSQKNHFSTRLYKKDASSHFLIRDWKTSQSKNHFCGKMELFTHILDCEASQYTRLECVKAPRFTNMWLLFSAAVNVNR